MKSWKPILLVGSVGATIAVAALGPKIAMMVPGIHLLFNGWGVTPVGEHTTIGDMSFKLVLSPDGKQVVTTSQGFKGVHLTSLDLKTHEVIEDKTLPKVWNGLAFSPDGKTLYVGTGNAGGISSFGYDQGKFTSSDGHVDEKGAFVAGLAVKPGDGDLYACDEANACIWQVDPKSWEIKKKIPVLANPHSCAFGADPRYLYVSEWGSSSVGVVDVQTSEVVRQIHVGIRPNDMVVAPDGRLFVSCAGDNTVHVIQTKTLENATDKSTPATRIPENSREILNTAIEPTSLEGSSPVGVSISPDGKTLYVANALNNDVMVADISDREETEIRGFIPTGWYPTSVLAAGDQLLVSVGKGLSSVPNYPPAKGSLQVKVGGTSFNYIGQTLQGQVSFMPVPDRSALDKYTAQVRTNTPFKLANVMTTAKPSNSIVPSEVGKGSPIKHVVYVVMENRTYDQVFGDIAEGNGDPNLCIFGEKITPNRHRLARDYVLMDNLYCDGEVSVDGHAWSDGAIANDANERDWTSSYASHGHVDGSDDVQLAASNYIWDSALRHGLTVKAYGEGTPNYLGGRALATNYRGTWKGKRDKDKVDGFIADLNQGEKDGKWPNFMIMSLGEDHTTGTKPGTFTPQAAVASNDQAIGKIVEAVSKSKFWDSTALFFIEDDAQNGPDHIDAHRTFGLVVGPYVKRHYVDHTMYTTCSMLRTIELLLSLPPMTQYDAAAQPMFDVFTKSPKAELYALAPAQTDLNAKNTAQSIGAAASAKMDFSEYDQAPEDELNRVLWANAKGPDVPYPGIVRRYAATH
ncbi:MAG: phosphoesterase [Armatimonadetes bacterium]|nr:phosphoesterase [Armatimonadota bacterium]